MFPNKNGKQQTFEKVKHYATTALQAGMEKAKAYEIDAGAGATGDMFARVRNAGKPESIKRDIDEDAAIKELENHVLRTAFNMTMQWTV